MASELLKSLIVGIGLLLAAATPALSQEVAAPAERFEPSGLLENPSLGVGLEGIADWSSQQPFLDVMKTARPWVAHLKGREDSWEHDDLARAGYLDENGWPTAMPPEVRVITTAILTGMPQDAVSSAGRYRLTYRGEGKLTFWGTLPRIEYGDGEIWFRTDPRSDIVVLTIEETDPNGTGDYIRDIVVVHEDRIALHDAGETFNPLWLKLIADFRLLRFMDWMSTNNSTQKVWADRPKPADYTYARNGVPLEVMLRLANRVGADPWFSIPHLADDDYIHRFAMLVKDGLRSGLKAHVELSNEVWNWGFDQADWAEQQGLARWEENGKWVEYYALRAVQMAQIWDDVFGSEAEERLVKVIVTQTGWLGLEEAIMEAPTWAAKEQEGFIPPYRYFDAYGVTGYFNGDLVNETNAPLVRQWIAESLQRAQADADTKGLSGADRDSFIAAHRYDHAVSLAAAAIYGGTQGGEAESSVVGMLTQVFPYHAAAARKYGLDLIMYEGGTHVVGLGPVVDDDEITAFLNHLNYTPEIAELYEKIMQGWREAGGTLFNVFVDVSTPSMWGSWGALRHLDDSNPRWNSIMRFNAENEAWWETRAPGTFLGEHP